MEGISVYISGRLCASSGDLSAVGALFVRVNIAVRLNYTIVVGVNITVRLNYTIVVGGNITVRLNTTLLLA